MLYLLVKKREILGHNNRSRLDIHVLPSKSKPVPCSHLSGFFFLLLNSGVCPLYSPTTMIGGFREELDFKPVPF